jgi:hypothetical protein
MQQIGKTFNMHGRKKKFYTAFFISLEGKERQGSTAEDRDKMVHG